MKLVRLPLIALTAVAAISFVFFGWIVLGCGQDNYGTSPTGGAASGVTSAASLVEISLKNTSFNPADVTINKGATVKWTNNDSITHTVTSSDAHFDSGNLTKDQTFEYTFDQPGTYQIRCTIHPSMKATVNVR